MGGWRRASAEVCRNNTNKLLERLTISGIRHEDHNLLTALSGNVVGTSRRENVMDVKSVVPTTTYARSVILNLLTSTPQYGFDSPLLRTHDRVGKHLVMDFCSVNMAKPFHAGHLRSTLIGNCIRNASVAAGMKVTAINFIGDLGAQVSYMLSALDDYEKQNPDAPRMTSPAEFTKLYVQQVTSGQIPTSITGGEMPKSTNDAARIVRNHVDQWVLGLETGDPHKMAIWNRVRDTSFADVHRQLGALIPRRYNPERTVDRPWQPSGDDDFVGDQFDEQFDLVSSESDYKSAAQHLVRDMIRDGLAKELPDGAVIWSPPESEENSAPPPANQRIFLRRSDGCSLYLSRDLAALLDRFRRFKPDYFSYVVDHRQAQHFDQLRMMAAAVDPDIGVRLLNDPFFHIRFWNIKGISTRDGSGLEASVINILEEAYQRIMDGMRENSNTNVDKSEFERVGRALARSGVIVHELSHSRESDYTWTWDNAVASSSDSGVALQYCHARVCQLLRKYGPPEKLDELVSKAEKHLLTDKAIVDSGLLEDGENFLKLIDHLARYDQVICNLAHTYRQTSLLATYTGQLCSHINKELRSERILIQPGDQGDAQSETRRAIKLLTLCAARRMLYECGAIMGFDMLSRM